MGAHKSVGGPNGVEVHLDSKAKGTLEAQKGMGSHKIVEFKRARS